MVKISGDHESDMGERNRTILGAVAGLLILAVAGYGVYRGIRALFPDTGPIAVSLSAYFDGANLVISGQVQPTVKGRARITVKSLKGDFQQSIFVDLNNNDGSFRTSATEMPALHELRRGDPLEVTAEVRPASRTDVAALERIYLYAKPPVQLQTAMIIFAAVSFLCIFVFFFAFTGPPSLTKDRVAIILSYCVILLFLILPLSAPIILPRIWGSDVMDTAVGFVITSVPQKDPTEATDTEWALNIGGYVTTPGQPETPATKPPAPNAVPAPTGPAAGAAAKAAKSTPAANTPSPQANPAATTTANTPSPQANPAATNTPSPNPPSPGGNNAAPEGAGNQATLTPLSKAVKVGGGLVIPLYVIILSVIGGAINMTRQVPRIQGAAPEEYPSFIRRVVRVLTTQKGRVGKVTETSNELREQTTELREQAPPPQATGEAAPPTKASIAPAAGSQPEPHTTDKTPATPPGAKETGQKGDHQRTQKWRMDLLSLYMYLISAPFLAIVTYYLLWWLDLTKKPILVLVSFSIGLISDQIVDKIIDVVKTALGSKDKAPIAAQH